MTPPTEHGRKEGATVTFAEHGNLSEVYHYVRLLILIQMIPLSNHDEPLVGWHLAFGGEWWQ